MESAEHRPSQVPGLDETAQRSWDQYLDASTLLYETLNRTLFDAHRLSLYDVLLLDALDKSEGGSVRMGDLAETLTLSPSRLSQQIRRLESQGLVRRSPSDDDRRRVHAAITCDGRRRVRPALATYAQLVRTHYLDHLSRAQMTALGDSSRRIDTGLRESWPPAKLNRNESDGHQ